MQFPVAWHVAGLEIPAHPVFEGLGYIVAFALYRKFSRVPGQPAEYARLWLLVGAAVGGALGAKLLGFAEWYQDLRPYLSEPAAWLEMKSVVGGLLGGWGGVELVKLRFGIARSTGDATVFPLISGISIGRIGCFLTGPQDLTWGLHSALPWAIDAGDGPRHPSPLYEIAFLLFLGAALWLMQARLRSGALFRLLMLGYLAFRLLSDFLKPRLELALGLSAIQLACVGGMIVATLSLVRLSRSRPEPVHG